MPQLNPRIDLAFKKIFGVDENKDLLISLINSIVSHEDQVTDVTLLNPYNPQNFRNDKCSILDIKAQGHHGRLFNIEIQITDEAHYDKRALYYWAKLYTQQLRQAEHYKLLNKAIGIHILNFNCIGDNDNYHNTFQIFNKKSHTPYFKDLELHTVELNKFNPEAITQLDELAKKVRTALDMWVAFLTKFDLLQSNHLPQPLNKPVLNKALDVMDTLNLNDIERDYYEDHLKWLRMEFGALELIRIRNMEKGLAEGIAKGRKKGLEEGIAKGLKEGTETVIRHLLKEKADPQFIAKATGLSIEDILKLKSET